MLRCKDVAEQASRYIDAELSRRQRWAMRLHLMICANCRRFMRQFQAIREALAVAAPRTEPSEADLMALTKRLQQETPRRSS